MEYEMFEKDYKEYRKAIIDTVENFQHLHPAQLASALIEFGCDLARMSAPSEEKAEELIKFSMELGKIKTEEKK